MLGGVVAMNLVKRTSSSPRLSLVTSPTGTSGFASSIYNVMLISWICIIDDSSIVNYTIDISEGLIHGSRIFTHM